jgi:16S rRNA (guanine527-N7)-methyltransferase
MEGPLPEAQSIVAKTLSLFDNDSPELLAAYLSEILRWNPTLGLVSKRDPLAACERLLLESLELARELGLEKARVADIGSGAGFPGLGWAISFPLLEITMIERREKRALFLERVCRALAIENATAIAEDARDVARRPDARAGFDVVSAMAVGDLSALATVIEPMIATGGRFVSTIATESDSPARVGTLELERRIDGKFGCYVLYRLGV